MKATTKEQYMFAILYLMTKFANQRQGIQEDTDLTVQCSSALEDVVLFVNRNYGFDLSSVNTQEECLKAESILGEYLSYIMEEDVPSSIEDENMLLKESIELKKEDLTSAKIKLNDHVKDLLSNLKISKSAIASWFLTPDYIRYFNIDNNENIIATKVISNGNSRKILLYHMRAIRYFSTIEEYDVLMALIFDYKMFEDMLSSPIRLYLFALDRFGIDIDLNGTIKRLFFKTKRILETSIKVESKSKMLFTNWQNTDSKQGRYLSFLYGIDLASYLKAFKNREI